MNRHSDNPRVWTAAENRRWNIGAIVLVSPFIIAAILQVMGVR